MSSPSTAPAPPKFKLSLGSKKSAQSASSSIPPKRPHSSLLGTEEHGDQNDEHSVASAEIISLGAGKATTATPATTAPQRVIVPIPNRDWRGEANKRKRQRSKLPGKEHAEYAEANGTHDVVKDDGKDHGLQIPTQTSKRTPSRPEQPAEDEGQTRQTNGEPVEQTQTTTTEDDEALAALTGIRQNNVNSNRIIRQDSPPVAPITDEEAFRHDFHSAPEAPSLDQYAATPIDGFGLALLRGYDPDVKMSEEEEDQTGPPHKKQIIQPRKDLLGLGAKEMDLKDPTDANGKKLSQKEKAIEDRKRRNAKKEILDYNPLARKNMKTGEIIDDEALKLRVEEQEKADERTSASASKEREDGHGNKRKDRTRDRRRGDDYSTDSEGYRRKRDRQKRKERDRRKDRYEEDREYNSRRERDRRKDRDDSDYDHERRRERHQRKDRDGSEHDRERRRDKESRRAREKNYDHQSSRDHHRRDRDLEEGRRR
ncbi:MAG: hypothetical protein M1831_003849 [Alyxoria varia]|nr:MAG: hypothetical protein M1831_003849 [Alyxoria varia]